LAPHVPELAEIGVSHVTVTVNGVDPEIVQKVYSWVRDGKILYRGLQAAELLLARQINAIEELKRHNITVKINTIVMPGINDHHILDVADTMKKLGADLLNCMAIFPNADTVFEDVVEPSKKEMAEIRKQAEQYLPQMRHCTRCRADAVGLLGEDRTDEMRGCLSACANLPKHSEVKRPYVAVATLEGVLVNQHLGEARRFQIWGEDGNGGYKMIEERQAPPSGGCAALAEYQPHPWRLPRHSGERPGRKPAGGLEETRHPSGDHGRFYRTRPGGSLHWKRTHQSSGKIPQMLIQGCLCGRRHRLRVIRECVCSKW
jgi:nitrogen fixation protein NifB